MKDYRDNTLPKLYSPEDIAGMLRVTRRTIYTYMKTGKLHASKIGGNWHISQENLDAFLQGDKQI